MIDNWDLGLSRTVFVLDRMFWGLMINMGGCLTRYTLGTEELRDTAKGGRASAEHHR